MEGGARFRPDVLGLDASYMPRKCSPAWKTPLPGWKEMLDETSAKMTSAALPPIFFRADDIGASSKAFDALCRLFRFYQVPLAMSVIPAWLNETRQERIFRAAPVDEDLWSWHQHGWRHINWQKEGARSEFGSDRAPERIYEDILQGRTKMERIFGPNFVPVFTPPWNHFSIAALRALRKLDFKGISATAPFSPGVKSLYGLKHFPARLYLHTLKLKNPAADFALLIDQFSGLSKMKGPTGIIIHHQQMTPFAFEFLDRMLYNLKCVIGIRFSSFKEMLKSLDERPACARLR
jgi:peptidoglycan/xylan/chitin deacetylase (PgdA/CDA1 family)